MSVREDANKVKRNIDNIMQRKKAAVFAKSLQYAGQALKYFRETQPSGSGVRGKYWTNQTNQARDRVFTDAFIEGQIIGWFIAHGVQYGTYLELANDRRHEALRPIIQRYAGRFIRDVRRIYRDN